jgi:putative transposase
MKKQKEKKEEHPILNQVLTPEFLKQFKDSGEIETGALSPC